MATQDPYVRALYLAHGEVMRETRSQAKRVPTDWRERGGYRKGLRQAAHILEDLAVSAEPSPCTCPDHMRDHP